EAAGAVDRRAVAALAAHPERPEDEDHVAGARVGARLDRQRAAGRHQLLKDRSQLVRPLGDPAGLDDEDRVRGVDGQQGVDIGRVVGGDDRRMDIFGLHAPSLARAPGHIREMSIRVRLLVRRERAVVGANAAQLAEAVWQGLLPRALAPTRFRPLVDVWETAATVHARVELAGVPEGSLVVGVADDVLVVEGDRPWAAI